MKNSLVTLHEFTKFQYLTFLNSPPYIKKKLIPVKKYDAVINFRIYFQSAFTINSAMANRGK